MCCTWDLVLEKSSKGVSMNCIVKQINHLIAFIYNHGFIKAHWDWLQFVKNMPRAAGTRLATFQITVQAILDNELAIKVLFELEEIRVWLQENLHGRKQAD